MHYCIMKDTLGIPSNNDIMNWYKHASGEDFEEMARKLDAEDAERVARGDAQWWTVEVCLGPDVGCDQQLRVAAGSRSEALAVGRARARAEGWKAVGIRARLEK
jgi:hypothetical protein